MIRVSGHVHRPDGVARGDKALYCYDFYISLQQDEQNFTHGKEELCYLLDVRIFGFRLAYISRADSLACLYVDGLAINTRRPRNGGNIFKMMRVKFDNSVIIQLLGNKFYTKFLNKNAESYEILNYSC